ncbi:hypothetical protein HPB49_014328 [Dermacentor silvarum]|uniref:Uncharacterized protein n=1 Tax=Dermacentor silvarum TaxID=543639 RepID=A0ACB8CLF7_DERSI|nr:hypothetical protein HPB49_014328 [Dermacentor silvarum]
MQLDPLEVIQDVPTRWNSEHAMMARLVKLRTVITVELSESDAVPNVNASEWKLMNAAVRVLKPLDHATTELSGDRYSTLSQVIPLLQCTEVVLAEHVSQGGEAALLASSLLCSIKMRFPDIKVSRLPALAMLVDPRCKDVCYAGRPAKEWAFTLLTTAAEETVPVDQHGTATSENSTCSADPSEDSVWSAFTHFSSRAHHQSSRTISDEVAGYLKAPLLSRSEDPLVWWKSKGSHLYPTLVAAARRYLSIPATQTRSERLFSTAGAVPLRPIIITRNELQKQVYGVGYPSIPIMTVDEFYAKRYPEQSQQESSSSAAVQPWSLQDWAADPEKASRELEEEEAQKEQLTDADDRGALEYKRAMDDWKDGEL